MKTTICIAAGMAVSTLACAAPDADARAAALLARMTQDEKLTLVFGRFGADLANKNTLRHPAARPYSAGYVPGVPRLGITAQFETDGGIGVATQVSPTPRERTALPSGIANAASWNPGLSYRGGAMIGAEARASGFNVMLAGGANLQREPRNGRNFEYAGEDPLLAGTMVAQQVRGIQSNRIVSTVKHFAVNSQETGRHVLDARIDDADARMSDLLALQLVVEQGDPGSVMCAYNRVNGVYSCESAYLLNEVLKQDWGYKGYVMSDWGAVHSTVAAANNGLDQQSGSEFDDSPYFGSGLKDALGSGLVPPARLDDMAQRILRTLFDKGAMEHPVAEGGAIDFRAHALVSRDAADEGIVLLKNADNTLPLKRGAGRILVIGAHADAGVLSGGGSSQVYPVGGMAVRALEPASWPGPVVYHPSSPLREIGLRAPGTQVWFNSGADPAAAASLAARSDVVVLFAQQWVGESHDATTLSLPDGQDALIAAVAAANPRTVVVLETGGPVTMPWAAQVAAIVEAWYPGSSGGAAIARVLFGDVNPSGRLPATFPQSESQLPRPVLDVGDPDAPKTPFAVTYHEGAAVGYKWFDLHGLAPLFPFGHGLSYTTFSHSTLRAESDGGKLRVRFTVSNSGAVRGRDVPQIYVSPLAGGWEAPKRLAGWSKVDLKPGASRELSLDIDPRLLAMYDSASKRWCIAAGDYTLTLARDAGDTSGNSVTVRLDARTLDGH
ncbi:MAG: glycoside hydrolase family 3 C-terminal domain-containing protein [Pseudomonadota bacterium]